MIILKQARSESDKVQQWWMLRLLLPGSAFIFIHIFWSGTQSAVRMTLSRWSERHSLRALSLFRDDSCITRRPGVAKSPSTRQVKVSSHQLFVAGILGDFYIHAQLNTRSPRNSCKFTLIYLAQMSSDSEHTQEYTANSPWCKFTLIYLAQMSLPQQTGHAHLQYASVWHRTKVSNHQLMHKHAHTRTRSQSHTNAHTFISSQTSNHACMLSLSHTQIHAQALFHHAAHRIFHQIYDI